MQARLRKATFTSPADKDRVMEYINRLDNFDGPEIAKIAISDEYGMYEEGFVIYTKFAKAASKPDEATELNVLAMGVLVGDLKAMERAAEFAERADDKAVWSRLAKAQLAEGLLAPAIASYLKADDHKDWPQVVSAAEGSDSYEELVPYLVMARTHVKETQLDTTLIYAYAMADKLGELEEFISAPNVARIDDVGERCFDEQMFFFDRYVLRAARAAAPDGSNIARRNTGNTNWEASCSTPGAEVRRAA